MSVTSKGTAFWHDTYCQKDVLGWFSMNTLNKAKAYEDRFHEVFVQGPCLCGTVRGSGNAVYRITISWAPGASHPYGECSCPVGFQCKHVAALLLKWLDQRATASGRLSPVVLRAINALRQTAPAAAPATTTHRLFFLLGTGPSVRIHLRAGELGKRPKIFRCDRKVLQQAPDWMTDADHRLLLTLTALHPVYDGDSVVDLGNAPYSAAAFESLAASGQLLSADNTPLVLSEPRPGALVWNADTAGRQCAAVHAPEATVLNLGEYWYLDRARRQTGRLHFPVSFAFLKALTQLPSLSRHEAALVAKTLADVAPGLTPPQIEADVACREITGPPTGELFLQTLERQWIDGWRDYPYGMQAFDVAAVAFRYGDVLLKPEETNGEYQQDDDGSVIHVRRDFEAEKNLLQRLRKAGFRRVPQRILKSYTRENGYGLASETAWEEFMTLGRKSLETQGWKLRFAENFRHHALEIDAWEAALAASEEEGWFDLDMGVMVAGERLALAPLLANLFQRDRRWLSGKAMAQIPETEKLLLHLPDGRRLRVLAARIKPIARTLIDLFDGDLPGDGSVVRLSRWDAMRLAWMEDQGRWQFKGETDLSQLAERLQQSHGVTPVEAPPGFQGVLRPYQKSGLAWLQYLRAHELSGILADDMGLGKTAQTLAHLLTEKLAGRLDRPALIVLPTSLVFNWKHEAARFAPDLRVLALHGADRQEHFAAIPAHDVILTTYPLLWRDEEALARHNYHLLILDEAQTVKNAHSKAAGVVRSLKARHRLCLTGTPLENHLGELWAQFDFLLPGFLGDARRFNRQWRTPIEKQGDSLRRELLARRLKPFILRRKKEEVATELPPKTVIVKSVELVGAQRDLYETVRAAMDRKVRQEIAAKGFRRSHIVILDALLKLRQVCCDPRLLKLDAAKKVKGRAKLDLLLDLLPGLIEEGRKVLIFSQFTSMLDLIRAELDRLDLAYALLTGETVAREKEIRRFQEGVVPIFLISLKAGGVGLNLTAADAVIHFDPWWNPAVENQATDRAHRLGQKKSVFVYKLIVAGSIEEKILALQEKKAALARGILAEDHEGEVKFSETDLAALFESLPETTKE